MSSGLNGIKELKEIKNSKILIDTDIIIDHLRGIGNFEDLVSDSAKNTCHISVITVAEIYSLLYSKEYELVDRLFLHLKAISVDTVIAKLAGNYRMNYYKSHQLTIPDAIIAASSKINNTLLITKNLKHFPMEDIEKMRPY
jgi:predicted nucleic acid-binding protein